MIDPRALDVLSSAMENVVSEGSCRSEMTTAISDESRHVDIRTRIPTGLIVESEWAGGSPRARIISGGPGYELEVLGYIVDDRVYFTNAVGEWRYTDYDPIAATMNGNGGFSIPVAIERLFTTAERIDILWEDDLAIACHLEVGEDYIRALLEEFKEAAFKKGSSVYDDIVYSYENLADKTKIDSILTIDKQSNYILSATNTMYVKDFEFQEGTKVSFTMEMRTVYRDYGMKFDIALPEDASNAEYVPLISPSVGV